MEHGRAENVGLQTPENRKSRASSTDTELIERGSRRLQDGDRCADTQGNPLQHRERKGCPVVTEREAEETGTDPRIVALAVTEVREEEGGELTNIARTIGAEQAPAEPLRVRRELTVSRVP
jgi:hypothetical protein